MANETYNLSLFERITGVLQSELSKIVAMKQTIGGPENRKHFNFEFLRISF